MMRVLIAGALAFYIVMLMDPLFTVIALLVCLAGMCAVEVVERRRADSHDAHGFANGLEAGVSHAAV